MLAITDVGMDIDLHAEDYAVTSEDVNMTTSIHDEQLVTIITELRRSRASYMAPESGHNHFTRVQQYMAELDRERTKWTSELLSFQRSARLSDAQVTYFIPLTDGAERRVGRLENVIAKTTEEAHCE